MTSCWCNNKHACNITFFFFYYTLAVFYIELYASYMKELVVMQWINKTWGTHLVIIKLFDKQIKNPENVVEEKEWSCRTLRKFNVEAPNCTLILCTVSVVPAQLDDTVIHCAFNTNTNKPNALSILGSMALCTPTDHPAECKISEEFSGCSWDFRSWTMFFLANKCLCIQTLLIKQLLSAPLAMFPLKRCLV